MGGLAADRGAGEQEVLADEMHQQRARFDQAFDLGAVHLHGHMSLCHCYFLSLVPLVQCSQHTPNLILRSQAKRSEDGRLERWPRVTSLPPSFETRARRVRTLLR